MLFHLAFAVIFMLLSLAVFLIANNRCCSSCSSCSTSICELKGKSVFTLEPGCHRKIIYKLMPIQSPNIYINVDTKGCKIGDQMIWMFQTQLNSQNFYLGPTIFYTACGDRVSQFVLNVGYERAVIEFTFDGEFWVHTPDNC